MKKRKESNITLKASHQILRERSKRTNNQELEKQPENKLQNGNVFKTPEIPKVKPARGLVAYQEIQVSVVRKVTLAAQTHLQNTLGSGEII